MTYLLIEFDASVIMMTVSHKVYIGCAMQGSSGIEKIDSLTIIQCQKFLKINANDYNTHIQFMRTIKCGNHVL